MEGEGSGEASRWPWPSSGLRVVVNYRSDSRGGGGDVPRGRGAGFAPGRAQSGPTSPTSSEGRRLVDGVGGLAGRVDLWINNAGIAPERRLDILETTPSSWDRVLDTNLRGPFFLTQAVARAMVDWRAAGIVAEPRIVFITSISSRFASVSRGEYCVAKAGLSMVAQLFAVRLAGMGIGVYEIRPGLIETDMTRPVRAAYDERIARGLVPPDAGGRPRMSAAPSRRSPQAHSPIPPAPSSTSTAG